MILQLRTQTRASIRQICLALDLPRSSFYHAAQTTASQCEDLRLSETGSVSETAKRVQCKNMRK